MQGTVRPSDLPSRTVSQLTRNDLHFGHTVLRCLELGLLGPELVTGAHEKVLCSCVPVFERDTSPLKCRLDAQPPSSRTVGETATRFPSDAEFVAGARIM